MYLHNDSIDRQRQRQYPQQQHQHLFVGIIDIISCYHWLLCVVCFGGPLPFFSLRGCLLVDIFNLLPHTLHLRHTSSHTYIHTSIYIYRYKDVYIHKIQTYTHTYKLACMHAYMHTYIHTYIHTLHTYMHTCIHIQTHINACIDTGMHAYTQANQQTNT